MGQIGKGERIIGHNCRKFSFVSFPFSHHLFMFVVFFSFPNFEDLCVFSLGSRLFGRSKMADKFDCDHCKESLYGRKYIQSDDSPYCIPCYDSLFSNTCDECKELIGHDSRVRLIWTWPCVANQDFE